MHIGIGAGEHLLVLAREVFEKKQPVRASPRQALRIRVLQGAEGRRPLLRQQFGAIFAEKPRVAKLHHRPRCQLSAFILECRR